MEIKATWDELRARPLFIGTPMFGGQCAGSYCQSMMILYRMAQAQNLTMKEMFLFNESLIPRARNYIADEFMRSGCTHLLFVDADIGFNADYVIQLLALAGPQTEYDIIAAPYPKKAIAWEKIKRAVDKGFADSNPYELDKFVGDYVFNPIAGAYPKGIPIDQPVEVSEAGTGFLMIQRKAFEIFADTYPEYLYTPDHLRSDQFDGSRKIMAYFHCDIEPSSNRYLSEDYWFCHLARQAGAKVWLCPWMELQHVGAHVYGGSLAAIAQLGASPTANINDLKKGSKLPKKQGGKAIVI